MASPSAVTRIRQPIAMTRSTFAGVALACAQETTKPKAAVKNPLIKTVRTSGIGPSQRKKRAGVAPAAPVNLVLRDDRRVVRSELRRHRRVGDTDARGLRRRCAVVVADLHRGLQVRADHRLKAGVVLRGLGFVVVADLGDQRAVQAAVQRVRNALLRGRLVVVTDLQGQRSVGSVAVAGGFLLGLGSVTDAILNGGLQVVAVDLLGGRGVLDAELSGHRGVGGLIAAIARGRALLLRGGGVAGADLQRGGVVQDAADGVGFVAGTVRGLIGAGGVAGAELQRDLIVVTAQTGLLAGGFAAGGLADAGAVESADLKGV